MDIWVGLDILSSVSPPVHAFPLPTLVTVGIVRQDSHFRKGNLSAEKYLTSKGDRKF